MADKRYLVAGTGISGIGAANLLLKMGEKITLYDGNDKLKKEEIIAKLDDSIDENVIKNNVKVELGELTHQILDETEIMVERTD